MRMLAVFCLALLLGCGSDKDSKPAAEEQPVIDPNKTYTGIEARVTCGDVCTADIGIAGGSCSGAEFMLIREGGGKRQIWIEVINVVAGQAYNITFDGPAAQYASDKIEGSTSVAIYCPPQP